jgi:hypothetical protein
VELTNLERVTSEKYTIKLERNTARNRDQICRALFMMGETVVMYAEGATYPDALQRLDGLLSLVRKDNLIQG